MFESQYLRAGDQTGKGRDATRKTLRCNLLVGSIVEEGDHAPANRYGSDECQDPGHKKERHGTVPYGG